METRSRSRNASPRKIHSGTDGSPKKGKPIRVPGKPQKSTRKSRTKEDSDSDDVDSDGDSSPLKRRKSHVDASPSKYATRSTVRERTVSLQPELRKPTLKQYGKRGRNLFVQSSPDSFPIKKSSRHSSRRVVSEAANSEDSSSADELNMTSPSRRRTKASTNGKHSRINSKAIPPPSITSYPPEEEEEEEEEELSQPNTPSQAGSSQTVDVEMEDAQSDAGETTDNPIAESSSYADLTEFTEPEDEQTDDPDTVSMQVFTEDEEPFTDVDDEREAEQLMDIAICDNESERLPDTLPTHFYPAVLSQKMAILSALQKPPYPDCGMEERLRSKGVLSALLQGSLERGEGNSCLVLGPKGCGKTRVVEELVTELPNDPIVVKLNGLIHQNDRLAMKSIVQQVSLQINSNWGNDLVDDEEDEDNEGKNLSAVPPSAHLPSLITSLPNLPRGVIVILDHFDLFTTHFRQALLYCLLDTVQSLRTGETNAGLAVVGVTSRLDTLLLLEKRVKSRFSHRIVQFSHPPTLDAYTSIARKVLSAEAKDVPAEWTGWWKTSVEQYLAKREMSRWLKDNFALVRETSVILELNNESPWLTQPPPYRPKTNLVFYGLAYPILCLLVAAYRLQDNGFDFVTFAMLDDVFQRQVKSSQVAPVTVDGASIGMLRCSSEVLLTAFENMIRQGYFTLNGPATQTIHKRWIRYRCAFDRDDVRAAVEDSGQTVVKRWFKQAQAH